LLIMNTRPSFSIIIPTYNRPRQLVACLHSLAHLNYPSDCLEIIVVNDGGEQLMNLPEVQNLREIVQPNSGPAAARNNGANQAAGEFLAFVDDDCQPHPDWLARLAGQLEVTPACLVGGHTKNMLSGNRYAAASQLLVDYLYAYYNQGQKGPQFFTSNNFALSAALFREMGGFDTTFPQAAGEDRDFCDRWRQAGHGLVYVPEAVMNHAHHLTGRSFWRQHVGYGRGACHFHQLRRQRNQEKVSLEPLSFYTGLVLAPFRFEAGGSRKGITAVLMAVTQLANAWGYFAASRRLTW
jgi:GT2 family glycosyltransferase